MRYVKVKVGDRSRIMRVVCDTPSIVTGVRVTKSGDACEPREIIFCTPSEIVCELQMNKHYGELDIQ